MVRAGVNGCASHSTATYEDAVNTLNSLQSNFAYLRNRAKMHDANSNDTLKDTTKYLERSGISLDQLDNLSVIHVAGTKGKGSACAFTESLLRGQGVRTGLYTSPHLISVRERFRINGQPIDEEKFARHFFRVYDRLWKSRENASDMPPYFKFLTVLMFNMFLDSPIDVAIIEVGIGGERDCTNIIRNPRCCGITSLGLDHTNLLGNTIAEIARQKSGIFKSGAPAFSVPQSDEAATILRRRADERGCTLNFVGPIESHRWNAGKPPVLGIAGDFQSYNASLAISLASAWFRSRDDDEGGGEFSLDRAATSLTSCKWPGRMQLLRGRRAHFYLDGAHTLESIECCASWFREATRNSAGKRVLVFNATGDRDSRGLLAILRSLNFARAFFVPNIAGKSCAVVDQINYTVSTEQQMTRCQMHCDIWGEGARRVDDVSRALELASQERETNDERINVLVTGSLHLVGAVLAVIDPRLTMSTDF